MTTLDEKGMTIKVGENGLVKVDGITVFRCVKRGSILYLEFADHDRMRIQCRGSKYIEVPLNVLVQKIDPPIEVEEGRKENE